MSVYNHMDLKGARCTYTAALPVSNPATAAPDGIQYGSLRGGRALKVIHTGSYHHLGNAWSTAIANQRQQKLKPSKQQAPFEKYLNDPSETAADQLVTEIYIPLR